MAREVRKRLATIADLKADGLSLRSIAKGKTARTAKERVVTSAGVPNYLPVIPAAQLKGAMRRGVTEDVVERVPGGVDVPTFTRLASGGVKGSDKAGAAPSHAEIRKHLDDNPVYEVFGAGERDSASSFRRS